MMMHSTAYLSASDKLFRLAIGLRMVAGETQDPITREQIESFLEQFGL